MQAARNDEVYATARVLCVAFELSDRKWKLAMSDGSRHRQVTVPARNVMAVVAAIAEAKRRWKLPVDAPVVSCYEAGRDGFWLHRALLAAGIANVIVDSARIEVSRQAPTSPRTRPESATGATFSSR